MVLFRVLYVACCDVRLIVRLLCYRNGWVLYLDTSHAPGESQLYLYPRVASHLLLLLVVVQDGTTGGKEPKQWLSCTPSPQITSGMVMLIGSGL